MELILVRHGLPERNDADKDPPLSPEGLEQARTVATHLAAEPIGAVYASPMRRAVETAQPFADLKRQPIRTHPGVVEFDRGLGGYIPMETLKSEDYAAWKAFVDRGRSSDDLAAFQSTVVAAIEEIIAVNAGRTVALFCHGGVINVWTAHVLGMPPRLFFEPRYASVHRYLCARSGERNVLALNEAARSPPA